jgi:hypothetical protein
MDTLNIIALYISHILSWSLFYLNIWKWRSYTGCTLYKRPVVPKAFKFPIRRFIVNRPIKLRCTKSPFSTAFRGDVHTTHISTQNVILTFSFWPTHPCSTEYCVIKTKGRPQRCWTFSGKIIHNKYSLNYSKLKDIYMDTIYKYI